MPVFSGPHDLFSLDRVFAFGSFLALNFIIFSDPFPSLQVPGKRHLLFHTEIYIPHWQTFVTQKSPKHLQVSSVTNGSNSTAHFPTPHHTLPNAAHPKPSHKLQGP